MRDYELMVIVNPEIPDEEVGPAVERVHQLIGTRGGEVTQVDNWGRRKLAYPIDRHLEGTYVLTRCSVDPAAVREIEARLNISEEVIRHLFLRKEG